MSGEHHRSLAEPRTQENCSRREQGGDLRTLAQTFLPHLSCCCWLRGEEERQEKEAAAAGAIFAGSKHSASS